MKTGISNPSVSKNLISIGYLGFLLLCLVELKAIYWGGLDWPQLKTATNITLFICFFVIHLTALIILLLNFYKESFLRVLRAIIQSLSPFHWLLVIILVIFPAILFLFSEWGEIFISPVLRIWLFSSLTLIITFLLSMKQSRYFQFDSLLTALVLLCSVFLLADKFKEVVSYPFTLYWSEGNRFWDYSLLFAREKYLYPDNQPIFAFIDLGRQNLWGLPFLLNNPPIWLLRLWNALLFTIPYIVLGWIIFRKKDIHPFVVLLCALWSFLFFNQGPIYAPLIFAAMMVYIASKLPTGWACLLTLLAGYYANLTRYSWSFTPAIWIGLLTAFYDRQESNSIPWSRLISLTASGLAGGLLLPILIPLANLIPSQIQQQSLFSTAQVTLQSQALIWTRLLPNPTYPPGIMLGLLLATAPLIVILMVNFKLFNKKMSFWQITAALGSSLIFLVVGLIASIKIGGGSNLHNIDMFLINLLLLAGITWSCGSDRWVCHPDQRTPWLKFLLVFMVCYPALTTFLHSVPLKLPSKTDQDNALQVIQKATNEAQNIGEVLFIDHRQLLTFGYIQNVPLLSEYEKKYLMNEALSGNQQLFDQFYHDLKSHRFALIVNEPIFIDYQAEDYYFGSENDIWVQWVSEPLLCYYRPLYTFKNLGVEILIPRVAPPDPAWNCPD
jgi:hypothetical protein